MQLICPHCGEPVSSDHINIQRMAAVCPACHNVFQFDPSAPKIKRRKVKPPHQLTSNETESHLNIAFRTNFRLDRNEGFLSAAILSVLFTFITILLTGRYLTHPVSALIPLGFGLVTALLYYWLALVTYNKTHIEVSDEKIKVSRRPLPNLLTQPHTIGVSGIEIIRYEETVASRKEGYDTPRYNVWAEMADGNHKIIVGDVVEDYAVFVSQQLNEFLDLEAAPDVSRLLDTEPEAEDREVPDKFRTHSTHSEKLS
jgi:hypothetical protein